jgi:hypothetical protein
MRSKHAATESPRPRVSRPLRKRPTPRWLLEKEELDAMARRRCLAVLSVLSGEKPVTEAIAELEISRGTYYQWEERALAAMLASLSPGSEAQAASAPAERIAELEQKVASLERDKRRSERLLLLTRKVVKAGPVTTGAGRPPKSRKRSTSDGKRSSPSSTPTSRPKSHPAPASTPKPDGADVR